MPEFSILHTAIPPLQMIQVPRAGALASFLGLVRDHHEGRPVKSLDYEAFEELALAEGRRILEEACDSWPIEEVWAAHRHGSLQIGDIAVAVHVWTAHRREAFEACAWIIDEIKTRLPIWKHEYYQDGSSAWVACHHAGASRP